MLCVPAVLLRGVSCVAGEQLTLTRYLPPTPAPAPASPPPPETPVRLRLVAAGRRQRRGGVRPDPRQWRHMVTSQLLYTALLQTSQRTVAILSTVNNLIKFTKIINVLISDCEGRMFLE